MRLTVNLNGTSKKDLIEARGKVAEAAEALLEAMRLAWPNGRDYQLSKNPAAALAADDADWQVIVDKVSEFKIRTEDEVLEIDMEGGAHEDN